MSRKSNSIKGFTLIEVLLVVTIIGMLAAIAIPMFMSQRAKAKNTAILASARTVASETVAILDDFSNRTPVLFKTEGSGGILCYEYVDVPSKLSCNSRFSSAEEVRTYTSLGDLLDQMVVYHNNVLGEISPYDSNSLLTRSPGLIGHVGIFNSDDYGISVIVNGPEGSQLFYQRIVSR